MVGLVIASWIRTPAPPVPVSIGALIRPGLPAPACQPRRTRSRSSLLSIPALLCRSSRRAIAFASLIRMDQFAMCAFSVPTQCDALFLSVVSCTTPISVITPRASSVPRAFAAART